MPLLPLAARAKTAHSSAASVPRIKFKTEDLSVDADARLTASRSSSKMASSSENPSRGLNKENLPHVAPLFDHT